MTKAIILFIFAFTLFDNLNSTSLARAEETPETSPPLTVSETNWKTPLEDNGLLLGLSFVNDFQTNHRGGLRRGSTDFANWDLNALIDTEKAGLWPQGYFYLSMLAIAGNEGSDFTGDIQVASNIEGPESIKLYQAWYEHYLIPEKASLLFGLHDLNCDFYSLEFASLLLNSSFGIGPEVSQIGISIYPTTALGIRLQTKLLEKAFFLAGVYDGVPGSPDDTKGTHISISEQDGAFSIVEIGLAANKPETEIRNYKIASGFWMRSTEFVDYAEEVQNYDNGYYLLAEKLLLELNEHGRNLGAFVQFGANPGGKNQISSHLGTGLTLSAPFLSRANDTFSLGMAHAMNSEAYRDYEEGAETAETSFELNYLLQVHQNLALQASLQWIRNPATDPELRNSFTSILRLLVEI